MQDNSVKELRKAIDRMAKQRDKLVVSLGRDGQQLAAIDSKIGSLTTRYDTASRRVDEFEATLEKYDETIGETEATFNKVILE